MQRPPIDEAKKNVFYASATSCDITQLTPWNCKPCQNVPSTKFIKSFNDSLLYTNGYIAVDSNTNDIIVAFRGSKNIVNYLVDISTVPIPISEPEAPSFFKVHAGFYLSMKSLSQGMIATLTELLAQDTYKASKIKFIGHSLGGAMASLGLFTVQQSLNLPWNRFELYTYGQPRTGDTAFAKWYNQKPIASARSVKYNDDIPNTPLSLTFDYKHHANELFIDDRNIENPIRYCTSTNQTLEDPTCYNSVSIFQQSFANHGNYFGQDMTSTACS
ncbi:alpha/beta-hydrolase [Neoconidiobolus thromboides FSU 785]|nr:alpha/beta-hydrolase [Neoconidiobolus thromboides FSU 785]